VKTLVKTLLFYGILLIFIAILNACTVLDFSCSTGQYGPRASVVYGVRDALGRTTLEDLSRLCSAEVEDNATF